MYNPQQNDYNQPIKKTFWERSVQTHPRGTLENLVGGWVFEEKKTFMLFFKRATQDEMLIKKNIRSYRQNKTKLTIGMLLAQKLRNILKLSEKTHIQKLKFKVFLKNE